jgi:hypothetical protein
MKYAFTCQCGKVIPVEASAAGSEILCECGTKAQVPSLSQLRVTSGEGAYEAGTIDTILRMLDEGQLPWGETCALSGLPTTNRIEIYVECEKLHFRADDEEVGWWAVVIAIGGWWSVFLRSSTGLQRSYEPQGRETRVATPLRVTREQEAAVTRMSQRRLRRLLRQVPIYDKLLQDYPAAKIVVGELPIEGDLKFDPGFAR